jgi:TRAP-type C4-dicarboxylate transport system substrate-binding protein
MPADIRQAIRRVTGSAVALGFAATFSTAALAVDPVNIRIATDTAGLPHPAAIAMELFAEKVKEAIPGSEVRTYFASSLYKIPEAVEAMTEGNLEMTWGQFGKTAQVDPYMSVVVGPMLLTTAGAVNALDDTKTFQMLAKRFNDVHKVKLFGSAHLSFYMGAGGRERLISPADFAGKKIRSMGPAENAMLGAFGANATTMAFGDVPSALQTGVIDGLLTSLGGFNVVKDQAPYYTIAGVNGIVGDYYWIGASTKWWNGLKADQREILEKLIIGEMLPWQKRANWCNDKQLIDRFGTDDPSKPGIYILKPDEKAKLAAALGTATADWIKSNTPKGAHEWVDTFAKEAKAAVAANPVGSSWLEETDCKQLDPYFAKFKKKS